MIGRVVLAALLAGVAAGFILGAIQYLRITPLILEAEKYENGMAAHNHGEAGQAVEPQRSLAASETNQSVAAAPAEEEWSPPDGLQRTLYTTVASMMAGAGFATLLAAVSLVSGIPITRQNGIIWGLCGFLAVTVATGAGLPPELPAMPAAELFPRQVWWVGTIAATGVALYLIALRREVWAIVVAVVLIALPHLIGAPVPPTLETPIPAGLAADFASNTVAAAAVFWCLIGVFLSFALPRFAQDMQTR